jgi:nicotinamide mononucleotide transporter
MKKDSIILSCLTVVVSVIALIMALHSYASWLEAISFVTGAICVWLTVKESVWNFPISLANVATFFIVFARAHLFADAGLQVVYFGLTVIGWYMWLYGGERRTELHISRVGKSEAIAIASSGIVLTFSLWMLLRHVGGSASFFDALTTSISLCAQWMLNRKQVENWYCWIAADVIYIPLYLYKGLYLTGGLYAVFLVMATMGLLEWRATWRKSRDETIAGESREPIEAVAA